MIGNRIKDERRRLGLNQTEFAALANAAKRTQIDWEKGASSPTAEQLAAMSVAGADIQYIVTGERRGQGIGLAAVQQAVLKAVDLLSLEKKVDAAQLAGAVAKLLASEVRSAPSEAGSTISVGGNVVGQVSEGGLINKKSVNISNKVGKK